MAAMAGPNWAILDRFSLGLLEGVLLPAAMAGVSTTTASSSSVDAMFASDATTTTITSTTSTLEERKKSIIGDNQDIKATASAIVIAGCYLGSAWIRHMRSGAAIVRFPRIRLHHSAWLPNFASAA